VCPASCRRRRRSRINMKRRGKKKMKRMRKNEYKPFLDAMIIDDSHLPLNNYTTYNLYNEKIFLFQFLKRK
jgi:hypothetical protein